MSKFPPFPTIFTPSIPSPLSPSSLFGFLYLVSIFILLLFIFYLHKVNIFNIRVDRPNCIELSNNVETEAPIFNYDEINNKKECVICLFAFEEGEKCRRMNVCEHVFHKDCIDEWFMVEHHCLPCQNVICVVDCDENNMDSSSSITSDRNYYNVLGTVW